MSSITWLDNDDAERQQMRELIALYREEGAVDELGLGRIRDAFSLRLFPGTSVLWNRARYLFFVPWVFIALERGQGEGSPEKRARKIQRTLAHDLVQAHGSGSGVIGARGSDIKQTPDMIMWAALLDWGIRRDGGRLTQLRADAVARAASSEWGEAEDSAAHPAWHSGVAFRFPENFPRLQRFELEEDESILLRDIIIAEDNVLGVSASTRGDSLFARLVEEGVDDDIEVPWEHPAAKASDSLQIAMFYAGCFSDVVHGARLAYARLVARSRGDDDRLSEVTEYLEDWAEFIAGDRHDDLMIWAAEMPAFWAVVRESSRFVPKGAQDFVRDWSALVLNEPGRALGVEAERMIVGREHQVKTQAKARTRFDGTVGRDSPAPIPAQYTYRFGQARQIAQDIRNPRR